MLVLPSHVAVEYGVGAFGQLLLEHGEQPLLLGEVGVPADIPGHNLLGSHVVYGREVRLAARRPELGDVRAQLHPRPVAAKSRSSRFGGFAPVSPWYELSDNDEGKLYTPEWVFEKKDLKRFK